MTTEPTGGEEQVPSAGEAVTPDPVIAEAVDAQSGGQLLDSAFTDAPAGDGDGAAPAAGAEAAPDAAMPAQPLSELDYVEMVAIDPSRAQDVPAEMQQVVLGRAGRIGAANFERGVAYAVEQYQAFQQATVETNERTATLQELYDSRDLEAFEAEGQRDPEAYREFMAAKAGVALPRRQAPPDAETQERVVSARALFATVKDDAARTALVGNNTAGKYPPTAAGYAALEADVTAVLSGQAISGARPAAPQRSPAERAAASVARSRLAKAEVAPGAVESSGRVSAKEIDESSGSQLLDKAFSTSTA